MAYKINQKNKTVLIALAVAAILLISIAIWAVEKRDKDKKTADSSQSTLNNNYTLGEDGIDETPIAPTPPGPTPAPTKLTYTDALKIYGPAGNNYRFQFSTNCLATPGRLSLKRGVKFMIDNRDTQAHTFTLGKQTFKVSKYGFVIVTTSEVGTLPLKCDGNTRADVIVSK